MWGKRYVFSLLGWSLIALLASTASYLSSNGSVDLLGFVRVLAAQAPGWLAWAVMTPVLLELGRRYPVGQPRLAALVAHLAGFGVSSASFVLVQVALRSLGSGLLGADGPDRLPLVTVVWSTWIGWLPSNTIIYVAIAIAGYALAAARRSQEQQAALAALEVELARAQLQALRMQINPHFLFNTLNTVAVFARDGDGRGAAELVARLSHIMRRLLRPANHHEAALSEELSFLGEYLAIEQTRFGDRLQVAWQIADESRAALVPQLILQPLVENALRHGLSPRAAAGRLTIAAVCAGARLELSVRDDGAGLRGGWNDRRGVGLDNVRARLARMYGADSELQIGPAPDRGTLVVVRLPLRLMEAT